LTRERRGAAHASAMGARAPQAGAPRVRLLLAAAAALCVAAALLHRGGTSAAPDPSRAQRAEPPARLGAPPPPPAAAPPPAATAGDYAERGRPDYSAAEEVQEEEEEEEEEEEARTAAAADDYERAGGGLRAAEAAEAEARVAAAQRAARAAAPGSPFLAALAACATLACVRDAHALPRGAARYDFPHFVIAGFQKAATTSLYHWLALHPQVAPSSPKEPEFFRAECGWDAEVCPRRASRLYLREVLKLPKFVAGGGAAAHFEASTHYVRSGDRLAPSLRRQMPWLRVVVSLREPISRATSMLIHKSFRKSGAPIPGAAAAGGCASGAELGACLLAFSQISGNPAGASSTNYSHPLAAWTRGWPLEQLHVIQYEELTSEEGEARELARLKAFIGVEAALPARALGVANARRFRVAPAGWPLARREYEALVALVRPDAAALVATLEGARLIESGRAWMARWEAVWDANLASCDGAGPEARCVMQLS
jgi:hypothetical protein